MPSVATKTWRNCIAGSRGRGEPGGRADASSCVVLCIKARMLLPWCRCCRRVANLRGSLLPVPSALPPPLSSPLPSLSPLPPPSLLLLLPQQGLTATEFSATGHAKPMAYSGEADSPQSAARHLSLRFPLRKWPPYLPIPKLLWQTVWGKYVYRQNVTDTVVGVKPRIP